MKDAVRFSFALDLVMLLALGLACAGGYFLWIGPALQTARAKTPAMEACSAQEQRYRAARADYFRVRRTLGNLLEQVRHEGGGMPARAAVDQRIAEMAAIAQACGVVIEEVDPEELPPLEEHLVTQVRFRARADYSAFRHFMRRVERQMPFLDITHFSLTARSAPSNGPCRITWSVRMYSATEEFGARETQARRPQPSSRTGSETA